MKNNSTPFLQIDEETLKKKPKIPKKVDEEIKKKIEKNQQAYLKQMENREKLSEAPPVDETKKYKYDEIENKYVTLDGKLEYLSNLNKWVPNINVKIIQQQMSIYNYHNEKNDVEGNDHTGVKRKREDSNVSKKKQKTGKQTSCIYVTGLPTDTTLEEVKSYFSKCGILKESMDGKAKIKFYKNEDNSLRGDCLIEYLQKESVGLAIKILDETSIRPGFEIKVNEAVFNKSKKNEDQNAEKAEKKKRKKKKKKKTHQHNKLQWTLNDDDLDWKQRSVIIKNMFKPDDFRGDPLFGTDLKNDLKVECEKKCGPVERIRIFSNNPDGVVHVIFKFEYSARGCIELMNGRYFNKNKLVCYMFDGKDYKVRESKEEEFKRLQQLYQTINK